MGRHTEENGKRRTAVEGIFTHAVAVFLEVGYGSPVI